LPDPKTAERITQWLNSAIDTKMMRYLKATPSAKAALVRATAVEQVDEGTYVVLQGLVSHDINRRFAGAILPVEWDDIIWRELNK
jgi:hypothetical protein